MNSVNSMKGSNGRGKIMAIGGAEDLEEKCGILAQFVELAGGKKACIAVMTVATTKVNELGNEYTKVFKRLGASRVKVVDVSSREQVDSERSLKELGQATGVFFTGGDQLQVTSLIGGSEMDKRLHRAHSEGVVIAGTSAGAAMMSNTMIVTGPPEENPRLGTVQLGPGMEFFLGGVIDTHFSQRGRHGRLITIVAQYPHDLGIGIDEDTAIIVEGEEFEVIGAGEVAISDERSTDPMAHELARLVSNSHVAGMLGRKAGVTHFHVGEREGRLKLLRTLIDEFDTLPAALYPTHVERDEALMREAIALTHRGSFVDIDTVNEDLPKWLKFYLENGGIESKLTVSSDASITGPDNLYGQIRACIVEHGFPIEQVLRLATENTSGVLKLDSKGKIEAGRDADLLVLREGSLEIKDVILRGRRVIKNGRAVVAERFLEDSNRQIMLRGKKP